MSVRGGNVRDAQNRNGLTLSRLTRQLGTATVRAPRKRVFAGPLDLPATPAAPPTTLAYQRLFLQQKIVANELGLAKQSAQEAV